YGHLSAILVRNGAHIGRGDAVGRLGSTGRSTGPHVHYEVWLDNRVRDRPSSWRLAVMFSSKKEETPMATITPTSPAPVSSAAVPPKKPGVSNGAPSIISSDLTVTGTLSSAGDMQIDGNIDGDVRCANLVVGESATVKGEIVAEEVVVRGRVEGSIRARKVQLCATCKVEGNILHETFAVESGALFEGNCR